MIKISENFIIFGEFTSRAGPWLRDTILKEENQIKNNDIV